MRNPILFAAAMLACLPARGADIAPAIAALKESLPGPDWSLVTADEKPTLFLGPKADSPQAYRIVLRQSVRVYEPGPQAVQLKQAEGAEEPRYAIVLHHAEIALADVGPAVSPDAVPWDRDLPFRQAARATDLGVGHGFRWLGHIALRDQADLRRALKLEGGDDPVAVAVAALSTQDEPDNATLYAAHEMLQAAGDAAVAPLLAEALLAERAPGRDETVRQCTQCLGSIRGPRADRALQHLYRSDVASTKAFAAYALAYAPPRDALKPIYLDMLRRPLYAGRAAGLIAEAGWTDALPALRAAYDAPPAYWDWRQCLAAIRTLEKRQTPADLTAAAGELMFTDAQDRRPTPDHIATARRAILTHPDRDSAALLALDLAHMTTKGGMRQANEIGRGLLAELPKDVTTPIIDRLKRIPGESERTQALQGLPTE